MSGDSATAFVMPVLVTGIHPRNTSEGLKKVRVKACVLSVMRGLDPRIHPRIKSGAGFATCPRAVDGRNESGHDGMCKNVW